MTRAWRSRLAVCAILLLTAGLRLAWLNQPGYAYDVPFFVGWMRMAAAQGIGGVFAMAESSYPPLAVGVMGLLGRGFSPQAIVAAGEVNALPTLVELAALRITSTACDILLAAGLYRLGRRQPRLALGAALLYALCPGEIFLSGWWGQIDAWMMAPLLLSVIWLDQKRFLPASAMLACALLFKLQAALLLPLFGVEVWRRGGLKPLLGGIAVGALVIGCVLLPLALSGQTQTVLATTTTPLRAHPWISMTSHSLWYALAPQARATGRHINRDLAPCDGTGLSFHDVGLTLLLLIYGSILGQRWVRGAAAESVFAAAATLWWALAMCVTRTHIRYIYPPLVFMLAAGLQRRRWWGLYGVGAVTLLINLLQKSLEMPPFAGYVTLPAGLGVFNAWINVALLALAMYFCLRYNAGSAATPLHRWEWGLLAGGGALALALLVGGLGYGRARGAQVQQAAAPLRASLTATLGLSDTLVVNWPGLVMDTPTGWLSRLPIMPPALILDTPVDVERPGVTWVQYAPWQPAASFGVEYYGPHVTQTELLGAIAQAQRIIAIAPPTPQIPLQMYEMGRWLPAGTPADCAVTFEAGVCLSAAHAQKQPGSLAVELTWQVFDARAAEDVTVFVHVLDAQGALVGQADGDPLHDLLPLARIAPTTRLRETRQVTADNAPPTHVRVGLYHRSNGQRSGVACAAAIPCTEQFLELPVE